MSGCLKVDDTIMNVIGDYAPQVGCELDEKERYIDQRTRVLVQRTSTLEPLLTNT